MSSLHEWAEVTSTTSFRRWFHGSRAQRRPRWAFLEGRVAKLRFKYRKSVFEAFTVLRRTWPVMAAGCAALAAWLVFGVHAAMVPGIVIGGIGAWFTLGSLDLILASIIADWAERRDVRRKAEREARRAARKVRH